MYSDACVHSEMRELTVEADRLAPLVIEAARFVAAGDRSQSGSLRLLVDDWVNSVCNRVFCVWCVCVCVCAVSYTHLRAHET